MYRRKAVFLDRDGTIIEDTGYISDPELVQFLPGAAEALQRLQSAGYLLVIVSNQSGIGRGWITEDQYRQVQHRLLEELQKQNVLITRSYYCPHAPETGCLCRKPGPGLLEQAARELQIDLSRSWMVGDRTSDIEAGHAAGCRTVLFDADWPSACRIILDSP
jgi:histidinol-phosphate phosphatase family protein